MKTLNDVVKNLKKQIIDDTKSIEIMRSEIGQIEIDETDATEEEKIRYYVLCDRILKNKSLYNQLSGLI